MLTSKTNLWVIYVIMIFGLFYVYTKGNYTTKADFKKETITPNGQRFIYQKIKLKAHILKEFCKTNGYNSQFGFIADFSIESNKYRFFVYNFKKDSIVAKGLVAHGSCNTAFLPNAKFKNEVGCGCSTKGKYKIGYSYVGKFGKAYKLHGLDTSNSLAFDRNIVLHAYSCVPNNESTELLCNSLGCPMLNYTFLNKLETYINALSKPIILWIVE